MAGTTRLELATSAVTVRFWVTRSCIFSTLGDVEGVENSPFVATCPQDAPELLQGDWISRDNVAPDTELDDTCSSAIASANLHTAHTAIKCIRSQLNYYWQLWVPDATHASKCVMAAQYTFRRSRGCSFL